MKRFLCGAFALEMCLAAVAQPVQMPQNVILTARAIQSLLDFGHWNIMPKARSTWDYFFSHYRRDP